MSDRVPFQGSYGIESVVSCNWCDGELIAIVDVVGQGDGNYGPSVLRCKGVEYLVFAEEAVADRSDLIVQDEHRKVFEGLDGFFEAADNQLLRRLKKGVDFGEYVNPEARHFIVRTPYNSFEFIAYDTPSLAGYHAN